MRADRGQFVANSMVVVKICLYFASLSVDLLCLASHNANQFLPLLFQRKRTADIYIFALAYYILGVVSVTY